MRRFLTLALVLLVLTPSLVCAMPTCGSEAEKLAAASLSCAEHDFADEMSGKEENGKGKGKVKLLVDCMGVDMQKAATASLDKPDIKKDLVVYTLVAAAPASRFLPADVSTLRGPPPDWPALSQTHPPILLTTQRLRV